MIRYLISHGANVNLPNLNGEMPLHRAAVHNFGLAAKVMLEAGASMLAKRRDGRTPVDVAMSHESSDVLIIFRNWESIVKAKRIEPVSREIMALATLATSATREQQVAAEIKQRFGSPMRREAAAEHEGPPSPSKDTDSMLTEIIARPPFEIAPDAEKRISADDLVKRWRLMEGWVDNRRTTDAAMALNPGSDVDAVELMESGYALIKLPSPKTSMQGRAVERARMLTTGETYGRGSTWMDPGEVGKLMIAKKRKQTTETRRRDYNDGGASVIALSEYDETNRAINSRGHTADTPGRRMRSSKLEQRGNEMTNMHNKAVAHTLQALALPTSDGQGSVGRAFPPTEVDSLTIAPWVEPPPPETPPPSRAVKMLPWAEEAMDDGAHSHYGSSEDSADEHDGRVHPLMIASRAIDECKQIAKQSALRFRKSTYLKLVKAAETRHPIIGGLGALAIPDGAKNEKALSPDRTKLQRRRRQVALAMAADTPSVEYNVRYTHPVDGQIMTRRPAIMSKTLQPARVRLDNRDLSNIGITDAQDTDALQQLLVGVQPDLERKKRQRVAVVVPNAKKRA
jgi:hypothetical protein